MNMIELKDERRKFAKELRVKTAGYLIGAFGLVAGLAWNDAIKALIENFFPLSKDSIVMKFVYALLVTLLIVIASLYLVRIINREEK
jgi:hypothetical protein